MNADDALVIALPSAGRTDNGSVHWWRIVDSAVVDHGDRIDWIDPAHHDPLPASTYVLGIAPAADVTLHRAQFAGLAPRQAETAARLLAADNSIAPASSLHVGIALGGADGDRMMAAVDRADMTHWLDWATGHGLALDAIVPAALLLPARLGAMPSWQRGVIADEVIIRSDDDAFVADPALVAHLVGADRPIVDVDPGAIAAALVDACDSPPINLRCGDFALRPPAWIDAPTLRRAAALVAAIVVVSLLVLIVRIGQAHAEIARLDRAALGAATSVLPTAPTLDTAIPQLDARLAQLGGGSARVSAPLAALLRAMDSAPAVSADSLTWRGDGTLSITLGAPRAEDINPVLIALQTDGYTITAQPRSGSDGRTLADVTIRSGA